MMQQRTRRLLWKAWLLGAMAMLPLVATACTSGEVGGSNLDKQQQLIYPIRPFAFAGDRSYVYPDLELDPAQSSDLYSSSVLSMIQVQLFTFDKNLNLVPDAANGMPKISDDGKTYTITLKDLLWSDGTPLTSGDFLAGMKHALDPNLCTTPGPLLNSAAGGCGGPGVFLQNIAGAAEFSGGSASSISGIETPDNKTLVFHLISPAAYFLGQLATAASMPLEQSVFAQYGPNYIEHYVEGKAQSGPFMIASWGDPTKPNVTDPQHSTQIRFVQNPHWYGSQPKLREIVMPLYDSDDAMYQDYLDGKIDFSTVPSHEYRFSQNLPDFHQVQTLSIDYFGINRLDPPFDNLKVRQAFALALNKQVLVDSIFQGARTPTNHIIPDGIPGHNSKLTNPPDNSSNAALTGDQDRARQMLQEVATACVDKFDDWCPFIIGNGTPDTAVSTVGLGGAECPTYNVAVDEGKTTQKLVTVVTSPSNPDRAKLVQAAAQVWSTVLCLNVTSSIQSGFYGKGVASPPGQPSTVSIWSVGWAADYLDAQDFTSLQFDPGSANSPNTNDTARFGYGAGDNDLVQLMRQADAETNTDKRTQMYENIEQQLVNDVAWIPFSQPKYLYRTRPYVTQLIVPANQVVSDQSWADVYILAHN